MMAGVLYHERVRRVDVGLLEGGRECVRKRCQQRRLLRRRIREAFACTRKSGRESSLTDYLIRDIVTHVSEQVNPVVPRHPVL